ncbi:MAG: EAL domain-containing protein [Anaeroplasmataceae bacterium]|nr:EAL domain-containing protein [Anaeroplasmataceae bacterium]
MRTYSLLYKSEQHLKLFIQNNELNDQKKYLIKIHSSNLLKEDMKFLIEILKSYLPHSEIIGCSVGGIIYKGENIDHGTLISFVDSVDTNYKTASVNLKQDDSYKSPKQIVDEIVDSLDGIDNSFLFTFYPPLLPYPSQVVEELNKRGKNFKMIGGGCFSSIGNLNDSSTYTICGEEVLQDTLVVAKLYGNSLIMNQSTATGIESIGRTHIVTKSKEHQIMEIDNKPAKQWFEKLLGKDIYNSLYLIDAFPIVRKGQEGYGLNIVFDVNPSTGEPLTKELFVFDGIVEGTEITAGYIDPNSAMHQVKQLCEEIEEVPTEVLFAYSCMTRRNILQNCAKWELQPFMTTQITGAFMAGELVWNGKECQYSNSAFSVASLSESNVSTVHLNLLSLADSNKIQFDNMPLVNYLFSKANSELKNEIKENKKLLADQMVIDSVTGLPNLSKFIYDTEQEKYFNLCLLSLKNENVIRVFLNKKQFIYYVNKMLEGCKHILGDTNCIYLYNELSILIADKKLAQQEFIDKMLDLRAYLYQLKYDNYHPVYDLSVAFGEEDLLKKVELAHLNLQKDNKNISIYYEDETNKSFTEELQMLQIINDAISYKRVIPIYQGIYNNFTNQIELYESLMRIQDQDGKIYEPGEFIRIAKEYKLYERLSKLMIEAIFEQAEQHDKVITINLNVQDIYNYEILKVIFKNLEKSTQPGKFVFEIVEGEEVQDYDYIKEFTNKIHNLGGKIAIDDFGSGYSNLLHVLRIDVDYVKIAGEIVKEIDSDASCQEFISMISNWANARNKKVIAEYVENEQVLNLLKKYNVTYSQGYLFSKPHQFK